jgi:hypothetical protein
MTSVNYMAGRKTWSRPQAMVWADGTPIETQTGEIIPIGFEIGSNVDGFSAASLEDRFIILSDHNRSPIDVTTERIEQRQRMANGTMRSYHIADKLQISTSWDMLPSRGFAGDPRFEQQFGNPTTLVTSLDHDSNPSTPNKVISPFGSAYSKDQQYTADGGAGGGELLDWYESHKGPFWVLLSYDKYKNFETSNVGRQRLGQYSEKRQMYISQFDYSIVKRGAANFDMWNVSVTLEEV